MAAGATITRVRTATYHFYRWRYESAFLVNLGLAGLFACLTGFGALVKVYLPWTPVPITGQLFFVLASAVVLGKHFGGLSQILYALVGVLAVPWFAGPNTNPQPLFDGVPGLYRGAGGVAIISGPTFGYILGFILTATAIGWAVDSRVRYRRPASLGLLLLAGIGLVYLLGAGWFYAWWTTGFGLAASRGGLSFGDLMVRAVIPFVPLDLVKAGIVLGIGSLILPNRPFAREKDAGSAEPTV
ncbi:MAG TPA: biotin transporter BioY [Thermoplasmata archaeon]|nr:biotin transporter BioY [Thermoplasmata archaeon]